MGAEDSDEDYMPTDFTPTMASVRERIGSGWTGPYRDELLRMFDRALAAHDAELREQIAGEILNAATRGVGGQTLDPHVESQVVGMRTAARIARGKE